MAEDQDAKSEQRTAQFKYMVSHPYMTCPQTPDTGSSAALNRVPGALDSMRERDWLDRLSTLNNETNRSSTIPR